MILTNLKNVYPYFVDVFVCESVRVCQCDSVSVLVCLRPRARELVHVSESSRRPGAG